MAGVNWSLFRGKVAVVVQSAENCNNEGQAKHHLMQVGWGFLTGVLVLPQALAEASKIHVLEQLSCVQ